MKIEVGVGGWGVGMEKNLGQRGTVKQPNYASH